MIRRDITTPDGLRRRLANLWRLQFFSPVSLVSPDPSPPKLLRSNPLVLLGPHIIFSQRVSGPVLGH